MTGTAHRDPSPGERRGSTVEPAPAWPKAVEVLRRMLASRTFKSVKILRKQVRRFDKNYDERTDWRAWSDLASDVMVMRLLFGCDCGRHRQGCSGSGCSCCVRGHRLDEWDPVELPLGIFLTNAVRGFAAAPPGPRTNRSTIKGDAFARSLLRPALDGVGSEPIRVDDVVARRCTCGCRFELPDGPDVCPDCKKPDHAAENRREPSRHVILLPGVGAYARRPFVKCRACQNLFYLDDVLTLRGCPLASCRCLTQLRCPARGCSNFRDVASLGVPCACGHQLTVGCAARRCRRRYTLAELTEMYAGPTFPTCACGGDLVGVVNDVIRHLVTVRQMWERVRR